MEERVCVHLGRCARGPPHPAQAQDMLAIPSPEPNTQGSSEQSLNCRERPFSIKRGHRPRVPRRNTAAALSHDPGSGSPAQFPPAVGGEHPFSWFLLSLLGHQPEAFGQASPSLSRSLIPTSIYRDTLDRCLQTPSRRNLTDAVGNGAGLSAWHCHPSWPAYTPVLLGRSNSTGQAGLSSWADRQIPEPL